MQGFEKGGYIVRTISHGTFVILILSYSLVMTACKNKQFLRKHEACYNETITCSLYIHKINNSKSRLAASILRGCICKNN